MFYVSLYQMEAKAVLDQLEKGRHADHPEYVLGARRSSLAGLYDLRACDALGERERLVVDQDLSEKDNEENSEDTADEHQESAFPVVDVFPDRRAGLRILGDQKRRDREDRAGDDSLSDRGRGTAGVFLEDRAFERFEHRHGHNGRRERGRYRHAGHEAEVGVRRTEDDREYRAEYDRRQR